MKCKSLFSEEKKNMESFTSLSSAECPECGKTEYLRIRFPMAVTSHRIFPTRLCDLDRSVSACVCEETKLEIRLSRKK